MISFKLNSQPFYPSQKSKYIQKKDQISNEIKPSEKKVVKVTTVYCSNYLKMFRQYNTELPTDCPKEHLDYITKTQEQSTELSKEIHSLSSSLKSLSEINEINKTQQIKETKEVKEIIHLNEENHSTSFTKRNYNQNNHKIPQKKLNKIETLKPIPIHHSHFNCNLNKDNIHNDKINEEEENEEIQSICSEQRRIAREKQIFFGKNTNEYHNYLFVIPKDQRRISDPKTPDIESSLSKRKWDRIVRRWRRSLHAFDNVNEQNQVELARALAFRLQNEENPKKTMIIYSSLPYSSYLVDE